METAGVEIGDEYKPLSAGECLRLTAVHRMKMRRSADKAQAKEKWEEQFATADGKLPNTQWRDDCNFPPKLILKVDRKT